MAKKFVIFVDEDSEPSIKLNNVFLHKDIPVPPDACSRAGGGYWDIDDKGVLRLSGESWDFGKYDMTLAQEAFDKKAIILEDKFTFDKLGIKELILR